MQQNYNKMTRRLSLYQTSMYNLNVSKNNIAVSLISNFNTFKSEKNLKFIRLYNLLFYTANQRPHLKMVKFNYIKKKILKKFTLSLTLSKLNQYNFLKYLREHYLYYYQIYYQKNTKYNHFKGNVVMYLDNPQFFIKNYTRHHQKVQFKVILTSKNPSQSSPDVLIRQLANNFLIKIKE